MLQIKQYVRAASLDEAYDLYQKKNNVIIGGMHWLKMASKNVGSAIDLSGLGLDQIVELEDRFEIGAMVSLRQLELHEGLNAYCGGAVRDAVKDIVGVQFRNTATIGGSLYGRYGFSDLLCVFLPMASSVVLHKGGEVALKDYAEMKQDRDILVKLIIKKVPMKMAYIAQRHARTDFAMLNCGVSCLNGQWMAAVGAAPSRAKLVLDEKNLLSAVNEENAAAFGEAVAEQILFGSNMRGSAEYRRQIAPVLVKRAVLAAKGEN